jgi:hypothetical protein
VVRATGESTGYAAAHAWTFSADILDGADRDLSLVGTLAFTVSAAGHLSGSLRNQGRAVHVTGGVRGRAVSLVFHLHSGLRMLGQGSSATRIPSCAAVPKRGGFTGPRPGDSGLWGYGLGG